MGGCTSSPLFKEQPLIEGELNAGAMRDPFAKEDDEPAGKEQRAGCCSCLSDDASCCRMFMFLMIILPVAVLFQSTQQLTTEQLGDQMLQHIGCGMDCQRALGESGYLFLMGLSALFAGAVADKAGHRPRVLAVGLVSCAVFTGICSGCGSFGALFVPRVASAVFNSLSLPVIIPLLLDRANTAGHVQYGAAVGILCLAFPLADGLLALLDWTSNWRTAFAVISVASLFVAIPLLLIGEAARREPKKAPALSTRWGCGVPAWDELVTSTRELPKLLYHSHSLGLLLLSQSLLQFGYSAVERGAPGYFVEERGSTYAQTDAAANSLSAATFPLIVAVAVASDVFVRQTALPRIWLSIAFVVGSLVLFFPLVYVAPSVNAPGSTFFIILYYVLTSTQVALNYLNIIDATPPAAVGRVIGMHTFFVQAFGSVGPPLMDACTHGKVFNQVSPYQSSLVFFALVPTILALCAAVPAAMLAPPCKLELEVYLSRGLE